jgi:hypothetical protein
MAMLGIARRTKTSNLESFAHWPTQRFETIAQAGPAVTFDERCLFLPILASVSGTGPTFSWKPLVSSSRAGSCQLRQFHERYRRVLRPLFRQDVARGQAGFLANRPLLRLT